MGNIIQPNAFPESSKPRAFKQKDKEWIGLLDRCDQFLTDNNLRVQSACTAELELRSSYDILPGYRSEVQQLVAHDTKSREYEEMVLGIRKRESDQIISEGIQSALRSLVALDNRNTGGNHDILEAMHHSLVAFQRIKIAFDRKVESLQSKVLASSTAAPANSTTDANEAQTSSSESATANTGTKVARSRSLGNPRSGSRPAMDSPSSRLRGIGLRMGLAMMKRAWKSDPTLFQESLELVREAFIDAMDPLSLYDSLPLAPFLEQGVSNLRSTFVDIIMDGKGTELGAVQQFVSFLLCFGISRGSASDILHAVRLILNKDVPYFPDSEAKRSIEFLLAFSPEKTFSPFRRGNESTSLGLRLSAADMSALNASSMANDGDFLYIHSLTKGLLRISCLGLEAGKVCGSPNPDFHIGVAGHMVLLGKKLYFFYQAKTSEAVSTVFYVDTIDLKTLRPTDTHILTFSTRDRDGSREGSEEQNTTSNGDGVLQLELLSEANEAEKLAAANEKGDQENVILDRDRRKAAELMQVPVEAIIKEEAKSKESAEDKKKGVTIPKPKHILMCGNGSTLYFVTIHKAALVMHTVEIDGDSGIMRTNACPPKALQFNGKYSKIGWQNIVSSHNALVIAINCGGGEFVGGDGTRFLRDQYYGQDEKEFGSGGGFFQSHTGHEAGQSFICHSCRFRKGSFWYDIPVPNGNFVVSLIFCEIESSSKSHRCFDVYVDDELVMYQYNPGPKYKKIQYDFPVTVTSGHKLKITFDGTNPMVSGIVIRHQSSSPSVCPPIAQDNSAPGWPEKQTANSFVLSNGECLLLGSKSKSSAPIEVITFSLKSGHSCGKYFIPKFEDCVVCMDSSNSILWKYSNKNKYKVQRYVNSWPSLRQRNKSSRAENPNGEEINLKLGNGIDFTCNLLNSLIRVAEFSDFNDAKQTGYMFPLGIELSSEMFTLLIGMISECMDEVKGGNIRRFHVLELLMNFLNIHLKHAHSLNQGEFELLLQKKSQKDLKSMVFGILGSDDSTFDNVLEIAAEICTSSLELFVPGWEEKINLLCQIMQPSMDYSENNKLKFTLKKEAHVLVGKSLFSRCNELEMVMSLFSHVEESLSHENTSIETETVLNNFLNAILHRLLDDFKSHLDLCSADGPVPTLSSEARDVIGFMHLVYCYFMSLTAEPFDFENRLCQLLVKHMSLFFRECATAIQLGIVSSDGSENIENAVSIIGLFFGKLWYQSIVYCSSFAHNAEAADILVAPCVDLSTTVLGFFTKISKETAKNLVESCLQTNDNVAVAGFPYTLGPADDLPDQATWGTSYALMDYPATSSGNITTVHARFGSLPQGNRTECLYVRIFERVQDSTSNFKFLREQKVEINRTSVALDAIIELPVSSGGIIINEGEFPALYNPKGSLNIRTRKLGAPQRTIYYTSGSTKKHGIGDTVSFTSYSNKDNRGALLPGWYAVVEAPMGLQAISNTGSGEKKKNPREPREEKVRMEYKYIYQFARFQSWLASKLASTLIKGSTSKKIEKENEPWLSSSVFNGNFKLPNDPMAAPMLRRSASSLEEEGSFLEDFTQGKTSCVLLKKLEEGYSPNMYMKMLRRKGGEVVDESLRSCFLAIASQVNLFEKALAFEVCAQGDDDAPEELLELWSFVQEKRQWFIREHEQLAGTTYETICAEVKKRVNLLSHIIPNNSPATPEGSPQRSMRHQFGSARKDSPRWEAVERSLHERNELSKMLQERSYLLSEKKIDEEPRDTVVRFLLSSANSTEIEESLSMSRVRARRRISGFKQMTDLIEQVVFDNLSDPFNSGPGKLGDLGNLVASSILQNCSQSIVVFEKEGNGYVIKPWSIHDAIKGCGARYKKEVVTSHVKFCRTLISVLKRPVEKEDSVSVRATKHLCVKSLCVKYSFDDKGRVLASNLTGALKSLLQPHSLLGSGKSGDKSKKEGWKITPITPVAHSLYEFLVFSTIALEDVLLGNFLIDLFGLLAAHLDGMLSMLQSVESSENEALPMQRNQYNYLENMPVRLGRRSTVVGLVIPRPPSLDASFSVAMNVYFDDFDRSCNILLFKRGNFHKCTENNESQALAYVNKDTKKIHFITKIRRAQNVDEAQVITDEPITAKEWHSLLFLRIFSQSGKDGLHIIMDGKYCGSSTGKFDPEALGEVIRLAEVATEQKGSFLPLYLGLPPVPPHYIASSTASTISEKYLQNHEKISFQGTIASVSISTDAKQMLKSFHEAKDSKKSFEDYGKICDTHKELEWTLDTLYKCTQIEKAKDIVSRPRTVQSLLSILLGVFDAREITAQKGESHRFDSISSSSPANKLQAARVLGALLKNIDPEKIAADQYISSYWTPENIVESLFQLYQHLDCIVMDSEFNSASIWCSARYSSMLMFELGSIFHSLALNEQWATIVIEHVCKEAEGALSLVRAFKNNAEMVSERKTNAVWRVLSALQLLCGAPSTFRIGARVKIKGDSKGSKVPLNRSGLIVSLSEHDNSASILLSDGEMAEDIPLDQLLPVPSQEWLAGGCTSHRLSRVLQCILPLVRAAADEGNVSLIFATLQYRVMHLLTIFVELVPSAHEILLSDSRRITEVLDIASQIMMINGEFGIFSDLCQKMEGLRLLMRDVNLNAEEVFQSSLGLDVSEGKKAEDRKPFSIKSVSPLINVGNVVVNPTYSLQENIGDEWECAQCQTPNPVELDNCEMCDYDRPKAGVIIGERWPQDSSMDLFHIPCLSKLKYSTQAAARELTKGYGVVWQGQASLSRTIKSQATSSFSFTVKNLPHIGNAIVRAGFVEEIDEEIEVGGVGKMFGWCSDGSVLKPSQSKVVTSKNHELKVVYISTPSEPSYGQEQAVTREGPAGPFLCSVKKYFPTWALEDIRLLNGKWYYEVEVVGDPKSSCPQIGWSDAQHTHFDGSSLGIGDCNHSWGVDGLRRKAWNGDNSLQPYGKIWKNGDRIGCAIDIDGKTMGFYVNNEYQGTAFTHCNFDGGVYPAFTLSGEGKMKIKVYFGGSADLKYDPPSGYLQIYEYFNLAKEKRDKVTAQWNDIPAFMAKKNVTYMKSNIIFSRNDKSPGTENANNVTGSTDNTMNQPSNESESKVAVRASQSPLDKDTLCEPYPSAGCIDPASSVFIDEGMVESLNTSSKTSNAAQWNQGSVITITRKYDSDQIAIFLENKLVHEISNIPQTFMHPFIQISGAGVAVQLENEHDLSSEKYGKYSSWTLESAISNETVYFGTLHSEDGKFVHLVRLFIRSESRERPAVFNGNMTFVDLHHEVSVHGEIVGNDIRLFSYIVDPDDKLERCTYFLKISPNAPGRLSGVSKDGSSVMILQKDFGTALSFKDPGSHFVMGALSASDTSPRFTCELWAKFDSPETSNGNIICCYSAKSQLPEFALVKNASTYSLVDRKETGHRRTILTAHVSDMEYGTWNHLAFSVCRARTQDWGEAILSSEGCRLLEKKDFMELSGMDSEREYNGKDPNLAFDTIFSFDIVSVDDQGFIWMGLRGVPEGQDEEETKTDHVRQDTYRFSSSGKFEKNGNRLYSGDRLKAGDNVTLFYDENTIIVFKNGKKVCSCKAPFSGKTQSFITMSGQGSKIRVPTHAGGLKIPYRSVWSFYNNGELLSQGISSRCHNLTGQWVVGDARLSETRLQCSVSEIRMWDKCLSVMELKRLSKVSFPTSKPMEKLIGWWPLVIGYGNIAYDVRRGRHGLLYNPTWKKTTGLKKEFSPEPLFWSLNNCHDKLKVDPMDASRICKSSSAVVGHTGMCKTPINVGKFQFNIEVKKLKNYAYIGVASEKMSKTLSSYIGQTDESWGLYSNGDCCHDAVRSQTKCKKFSSGDLVTVFVDTILGTITWAVNGETVGFKYSNLRGKTVFPAVTLFYSEDEMVISRNSIDDTVDDIHSTIPQVSQELTTALSYFETEGNAMNPLLQELDFDSFKYGTVKRKSESESPKEESKISPVLLGDIGDQCAAPMSEKYDGSFDEQKNGNRNNAQLCEGAQRTVCVQGPMWRLAIVSQMTHTARALTVMHARRVILNILQSSSVDLSFVVDAFASNVTSILNFSRLLVATNEPSNTEAFGEQVTRLLVSHSKDSDSVAQAILGEAISVLMSSIYKMKAVYDGKDSTKCLDVIDDKTSSENPNPHFGFWLLRLILQVPVFLQKHSSTILAALFSFISFTEGSLRVEGVELLVKMVASFNQNSLEWSSAMTSRLETHFFAQLKSLYKSEPSRNTKYMGSLVRLHLELLKVDSSVASHLPEWFLDVNLFFEICETLEDTWREGVEQMSIASCKALFKKLGFLESGSFAKNPFKGEGTEYFPSTQAISRSSMKQLVQVLDNKLKDLSHTVKSGDCGVYLKVMKAVNFEETLKMKAFLGIPEPVLRRNALILCAVNCAFEITSSFVDFDPSPKDGSLMKRLMAHRYLIFWSHKHKIWRPIMRRTYENADNVHDLGIDRIATYSLRGKEATNETLNKSVFGQLVKNLHYINPKLLRHKSREQNGPHGTWRVDFIGESSIDQGGPFRDTLTQSVTDLQESHVRMIVKVPNNRNNQGEFGRDKFVPNPKYISPQHLQMWRFVGKTMGVALRINNPLPFDFPSLVWKLLVLEKPGREDLRGIDDSFCKIHDTILKCDEALVSNYEMNHVVVNNAGEEVPLYEGGEDVLVTGDNCKEYVNLCESYRVEEISKQCLAMREGLSTIVPIGVVNMWTWEQLELNVCGKKGFDIELLKEHADFKDGYASDTEFQSWMWESLGNFNEEEREQFLRFCWGRSRLPIAKDGWTHPFTVTTKRGNDDALPSAHTCFFQIDVPRYSSQKIMEKRLRIAINWGNSAIDDD
jgi:hypothetical protein